MARSIGFSVRGTARHVRGWADTLEMLKRRLLESLGLALLLACSLLTLALATYDPPDPSLNTAVDAAPHNFLGYSGAVLADLLRQSLGFAAFLIPMVLLGWCFRLLLNRPLISLRLKVALLPVVLVLGAFALSVLDLGTLSQEAKFGGAVGWGLQGLLMRASLSAAALPISVVAAGIVGLLMLLIMGLSWRDWRDIGEGAGRNMSRIGAFSGRRTIATVGVADRLVRYWRDGRHLDAAASASGLSGPGRPAAVTMLPDRREPRLDRGASETMGAGRSRGGFIRFIAPRAKPLAPGRRADQER